MNPPERSSGRSRVTVTGLIALIALGCQSSTPEDGAPDTDDPPARSVDDGSGAGGGAPAGNTGAGPAPSGSRAEDMTVGGLGSGAAGSAGENTGPGGGGLSTADAGTDPSSDPPGSVPEPACPPSASATPGETARSVTVGATNRTYVLHVPPGYDGTTPVPVVIDFHPLGGTGMSQKGLSGWGTLADSEGFIVVWPNGVGNSWNVGRCCPPAANQGVDDVAFVRAMIEQLQNDACIDSRRIYATGCSNGGGMSYKVACEAADVIAAVAPVDFDCVVGPNNVPSCGGCNPARPISEIQFRATNDRAVNYFGGPAPIPQGMDFPGAEQNFADWGDINACTGAPEPLEGHAVCQTFPSCEAGAETTLCTQQGGSHCGNYASLDIVNVAWETFQRASLP